MPVLNNTLVGQKLKVNHPFPIITGKENDRNLLHPFGFPQCEGVEQLIERSESPREHDQRLGPQQEVHLADREINNETESKARG